MAYFDHNATSPIRPGAREAFREAEDRFWANPSSPYRAAGQARLALEQAREELAGLIGVEPRRLVFTSGATESNHLLLASYASATTGPVLIGATEHPAVLDAARHHFGDRTRLLPVDPGGYVTPETVLQSIEAEGSSLVSVMAANNETGILSPIETIAELCREHAVPFHTDAAQLFGKANAMIAQATYVTGSAHKFGGPRGVGFLVLDPTREIVLGQRGGTQEHNRRAGTENVPGVLAMVAALREAIGELDTFVTSQAQARDAFETAVPASLPGTLIVGRDIPRLPQTSFLIPPRYENTRWVSRLDRLGFEVSTGSACATGKEGPSHVLAAMRFEAHEARRAIRVSGGPGTSSEDWDALAKAMAKVAADLDEEATERPSGTQVIDV